MPLCLVVIVLVLSARGPNPETPTWQEQYDLGVRYLSEGNYEEAIIAFTAAIEIDPKQALAYVGRGDAHTGVARLAAGDATELSEQVENSYESALADYLTAIDLDILTAEVYLKAADVYLVLGDVENALLILSRGLEATDDEFLRVRLEELTAFPYEQNLPKDLPKGDSDMIVSMYSAEYGFQGHDAYIYDKQGRMISNRWYGADNEVIYSQSWVYNDATNTTTSTIIQETL